MVNSLKAIAPVRAAAIAAGAFAVVALAALLVAVIADVRAFDSTQGGYEYPYTGYTGSPIDWSTTETTASGMRRNGRVLHFLLDCRSGMIGVELAGLTIPFRKLSPRALAVHRPYEACVERGFEPDF